MTQQTQENWGGQTLPGQSPFSSVRGKSGLPFIDKVKRRNEITLTPFPDSNGPDGDQRKQNGKEEGDPRPGWPGTSGFQSMIRPGSLNAGYWKRGTHGGLSSTLSARLSSVCAPARLTAPNVFQMWTSNRLQRALLEPNRPLY